MSERLGALRAGCRWINLAAASPTHPSDCISYSLLLPESTSFVSYPLLLPETTGLASTTHTIGMRRGVDEFRGRIDGLACLLDWILHICISKVLLNNLGARIVKNSVLGENTRDSWGFQGLGFLGFLVPRVSFETTQFSTKPNVEPTTLDVILAD